MTVTLTLEEVALLTRLVELRLQEIGTEIRHTRTVKYRDVLKNERTLLRAIRERLEQPAAAAAEA